MLLISNLVTIISPTFGYKLLNRNDSSIVTDPNAPKKPANAFLMYCQEKRLSASLANNADKPRAEMSHADLTKQLAKEWNDLEEKDKKVLLLKFIFSEMMFFDVYGVALYLFMFVNVFMQRESCSE